MPSPTSTFPGVMYGGDYNPEQWPEPIWDRDVEMMREAGVNLATLPVFGWVHLQPDEDTFTFDWLDRVVDKLHRADIRICMATATASVPAWVDQKYPAILRVDHQGRKMRHSFRHSFCPNSPDFRRLSTQLAGKLAERYGKHPAVLLWHINNEYGRTCYCETCAAAFRDWLRDRYGSLEEVNRRWYTAFWGKTFTHWEQIEPPFQEIGEQAIMALRIDYDRFQSDSLLACYRAEYDAIRAHSDLPITTNLMGAYRPLDYHRWAPHLDVVSWDSYPRRGVTKPSTAAFNHSLMRGLKQGLPWMLMEQSPSQTSWAPTNPFKRPGEMRLQSYQAMAHGADSILFFQWRQSRGAFEKFHGAIVEQSGRNDTRVFREVAALGAELSRLGTRTLGGRVEARAAMIFDWDTWWAREHSKGPCDAHFYPPACRTFYHGLHRHGHTCDVVSADANLSGYKLLIAPMLMMVKPGWAQKLEAFVRDGGILLAGCHSGVVDETDLRFDTPDPGPLRELFGFWREETDILPTAEDRNQFVFNQPWGSLEGSHTCSTICERIHPETASTLAVYGSDFYVGEPAITANAYGKGMAVYLASVPGEDFLAALMRELAERTGLPRPLGINLPEEVEATVRVADDGTRLHYVLNHSPHPRSIPLPEGTWHDLLSDSPLTGETQLPGYGVWILCEE